MFKKVYCTWEGRPDTLTDGQDTMPNTLEGQHERTYLVQCWVHPTSGKDVVEQNKAMDEFKFFLSHVFYDDKAITEGLKQFEQEVDGFVLRPFFMRSYHPVDNPEIEFLPQIHISNPEARFASCQEIPNSK